jgi:DNA-directed RNA polymerase specialized sigma24 family protein
MSDAAESSMEPEESTLGAVLAEILSRRRAGESPVVAEYLTRNPELRGEILDGLEAMDFLENAALQPAESAAPSPNKAGHGDAMATLSLGQRIAELSPSIQRLLFLRNFEKRRWSEISELVGEPEIELRRLYARAVRDLIQSPGARR